MTLSRRELLEVASVAAGGLFLFGCDPETSTMVDAGTDAGADGGTDAGADGGTDAGVDAGADAGGGAECADPFANGQSLAIAAFAGETQPLDTKVGAGLGGRLFTDLTRVTASAPLVPNDRFYIRTFYPPTIDRSAAWEIHVRGLVAQELVLSLDDLRLLVVPQGAVLLECSGNFRDAGNGMLSAAEWAGVPIADVLALCGASQAATRVLISGFDYTEPVPRNVPGASWIFTPDELIAAGAFFATEMNGVPLPDDHGFPVRLCVPGWYGCTNIKWVNELIFVDDNEPSTPQMIEFASRTHQNGEPALARDFMPATIDQAAMPIRIEKWRVDGQIRYKVDGVLWGGSKPTNALSVRFGDEAWQPVDVCPEVTTNKTWSFWSHEWRPSTAGTYAIRCRIDDPTIRTRRLDVDRYLREVEIDEV